MYEYEITVIVPTYNSSKTIERTIHSILSQDFKNFEIVFVDDASSDDTVDTILNVLDGERVHSKIIVNKTNKGPAYSRNRGLEASKGHYIIFVDSDDLIQFNHLSSLHHYIGFEGIDSVFTKGIKVDNRDVLLDFQVDKFDPLLVLARDKKGIIKSADLINLELLMKIPFSFVLLIYDKEIIEKNSIGFNEDYKYAEDTDFALRYLAHCDRIRIIDKYTYFYYEEDDSLTKKVSLNRFDSVVLFEELSLYFQRNGQIELAEKVLHSRVPKFIFGNMNYFFYNSYSKDDVFRKMDQLNLFEKLKMFKRYDKGDLKFKIKSRLFLLNPDLYYNLWIRLKK